eukprot:3722775-Amphidinium_carterae.1
MHVRHHDAQYCHWLHIDIKVPPGQNPEPPPTPQQSGSSRPQKVVALEPSAPAYAAGTAPHGWSIDDSPLRERYVNSEQLLSTAPPGCFTTSRTTLMGGAPSHNVGFLFREKGRSNFESSQRMMMHSCHSNFAFACFLRLDFQGTKKH